MVLTQDVYIGPKFDDLSGLITLQLSYPSSGPQFPKGSGCFEFLLPLHSKSLGLVL